MNCKNVQASLSAYLDREMSRDESLEIREHLADCERCREEEAALVCLKQLLRGVPTVEPDEAFESRLTSAVFGGKATTTHAPTKVSYLLVSGVAAAAMLTTLVLLSAIGRNGETRPSPQPSGPDVVSQISQDRAFDAGSDPLSGTPVVMPMNYAHR
jgi:anti-sigma factor RsiW